MSAPARGAHGARSLPRSVAALAVVALAAILFLPSGAQSVPGQPDRGFGVQGSVVTDLQGRSSERCFELLVQPDRKLVCIGQSVRRGSESEDVAIVRYLPDGRLDRDFGSGGIRLFDSGLGVDDIAASAVLAPDGKIVGAGVADVAGRQDLRSPGAGLGGVAPCSAGGARRGRRGGGDGSPVSRPFPPHRPRAVRVAEATHPTVSR
jgi:Domain of unknown function (DUF5122) beta-propeller